MEPELVASNHSGAMALALLAAALLVGAALVVRAKLRARSRRARADLPMFLVVGACVVAGGVSSAVLFFLVTSRALYVRGGHVELVERRLWGERVVERVPGANVQRVVLSHWTTSGHRNVTVRGATLYFETRHASRAAAIDAGSQGEGVARSLAEKLGVPLAILSH